MVRRRQTDLHVLSDGAGRSDPERPTMSFESQHGVSTGTRSCLNDLVQGGWIMANAVILH